MSFHQVAHLAFHSPCCMCVCVWMSKHATMRAARLSVQSLWASGGLGEWGRSGEAVWIFCNRGNSVRGAHILTTLSVVFLNVGVQIFLYPSAVSTQLTFLTRFIVFKGFFSLQRQTHLHQFGGTIQLEGDLDRPQKCHHWLGALAWSHFDNEPSART